MAEEKKRKKRMSVRASAVVDFAKRKGNVR